MGLLLLRYGEIALKGQNRTYFFRKLRHNLKLCLKANNLQGRVWQEGQRIYLETEQVEEAIAACRRVFGVVSLSPVQVAPRELEAVGQVAVDIAHRAGLDPSRSFRVQARRADKSYPYISPEIERHVGGMVAMATGAPVDLSKGAGVEIGVEVQYERVLVYGETIRGPGGSPVPVKPFLPGRPR